MSPFDLAIVATTALMMVAVGMSLDARGLASLQGRPALVAATLAAHALIVPLLALAASQALSLPAPLTLAVVLIAACPVGDILNFYTLVARGNVPLAIALNTASCFLAPATMALVFAGLPFILNQPDHLAAPGWALTLRVLFLALLPIVAGFALRVAQPNLASRLLPPTARVAGAAILAVLAWALVRQRASLALIWSSVIPVLTIFLVASTAAGLAWARAWKLPNSDTAPVTFSFPVRNVGLAAALASLLGKPEALSVIALYFLIEVPLFLAGARLSARIAPPVPATTPRDSTIR